MFTWGFVRSNAVAYALAAFNTEAPPSRRRRACCSGLTELPCCSADLAVRRKGVSVRENAGIIMCVGEKEREEMRMGWERGMSMGQDKARSSKLKIFFSGLQGL